MKIDQNSKKLKKMIQEGFIRFLTKNEILQWMPHGTIETFPKENIVFYEEHFPIGLYVFMHGSIIVNFINARKRKQIIIREPVMLGLNHLLESSPYYYTVQTYEKSQFIFLPRNCLEKKKLKKNDIKLTF